MFGWFLVIVLVVAVFSAHKLPALKENIKTLTDKGIEAAKKGKEKAEEKLKEVKEKKNNKK